MRASSWTLCPSGMEAEDTEVTGSLGDTLLSARLKRGGRVKASLCADIVDGHPRTDETLQRTPLFQLVSAKPAAVHGAARNPAHAAHRSAAYVHDGSSREHSHLQTQKAASQRPM